MIKLILFKVLTFFLFTSFQGFAQVIRVIDCESKEVIPYFACFDANANIFLSQGGENGELLMTSKTHGDLIRIKAFGYQDAILKIDTTRRQLLCMQQKDFTLHEVDVRCQNEFFLGVEAKKSSACSFVMKIGNDNNYRRGLFFENSDTIYLYEVAFFVDRGSKKGSPFRAVLYEGLIQRINDDADSEVIFSEPQKVTCRNCWHVIHFAEPVMLTESFLVALEWLPEKTGVDLDFSSDDFHGLKLGTFEDNRFLNVLSINFGDWQEVKPMRCEPSADKMMSPMIRMKVRK